MEDLKMVIQGAWNVLNMEMTLYGFTFSWFNVMAVVAICGLIFWFIRGLGD